MPVSVRRLSFADVAFVGRPHADGQRHNAGAMLSTLLYLSRVVQAARLPRSVRPVRVRELRPFFWVTVSHADSAALAPRTYREHVLPL